MPMPGDRPRNYIAPRGHPARLVVAFALALAHVVFGLSSTVIAQTTVDQDSSSVLVDPHDWLGPLSQLAAARLDAAAVRNDCTVVVSIFDSDTDADQPPTVEASQASIAIDTATGAISVEDQPTCPSVSLLAERIGTERPDNQLAPTPESLISAFDSWVAPTSASTAPPNNSRGSDIIESENPTFLIIACALALGLAVAWLVFRRRPFM